jgi:hypothetical protein
MTERQTKTTKDTIKGYVIGAIFATIATLAGNYLIFANDITELKSNDLIQDKNIDIINDKIENNRDRFDEVLTDKEFETYFNMIMDELRSLKNQNKKN